MHLTTLVELLEAEIGVSPSARAKLDALVAERAPKKTAARTRIATTECADGSAGAAKLRTVPDDLRP